MIAAAPMAEQEEAALMKQGVLQTRQLLNARQGVLALRRSELTERGGLHCDNRADIAAE